MAEDSSQNDSPLKSWVNSVFSMYDQIVSTLEILLGDLQGKWPDRVDDLLVAKGHAPNTVAEMDPLAKLNALQKIYREQPTHFEQVSSALDLIFELRYGYEPGDYKKMTFPEVLIALEHACEYDAPGKPSIWEITK